MTGDILPGSPQTVESRQQEAQHFIETYFDDEDEATSVEHSDYQPQPITEQYLLGAYNRALLRPYGGRFKSLWEGKWEGDYKSQSDADLAAGELSCL